MQNTIRAKLQEKANEIAREKIEESYDLAAIFGLKGDLEIQVSGVSSRARGVLTTVKTTLDDLSEELRTFLEEHLPPMLFDALLREHLDAEVEAKDLYADSVNDRVREEGR